MRKDGRVGMQPGKIMNGVDRGWQRPSLMRNGSPQRDGDIDPSVTFPPTSHSPRCLSYKYKPSQVCTHTHTQVDTVGAVYTLITQCQHALCLCSHTHTTP